MLADEDQIDLHGVALRPELLAFLLHFLVMGGEVEACEGVRVVWFVLAACLLEFAFDFVADFGV